MNLSRALIASICLAHAPGITPVPGIDSAKLLWGVAGNESSFGDAFAPRHEASYCYEGPAFNAQATKVWGCLAHCSYGPWQVMFANFPPGISPILLAQTGPTMAEACVIAAVAEINSAIKRGAATIPEIAEVYNAGSLRPRVVPAEYMAKLLTSYKTPMPQLEPAPEAT